MGLVDISCSSNYSSEIYQKWIWLIYLGCSRKCWIYDSDDDIEMNTEVSHSISLPSCAYLFHFVTMLWDCHFSPNFSLNWNPIYRDCSHNISTKSIFDISRSRNYSSEIYQPNPFSIYLAQEITQARYINQIHFQYISCSRSYLSEIYQPNPFSIYLARVITRARYIKQFHFRYILLKKLLEQDISTKSIFDISRSSNYSSEIYQPNPFPIYLAQEITQARYINQIHFRYILLKKLLERDISTKSIFNISLSSNYSSKIYQPIQFLSYLAQIIFQARYINQSHFWYILLE